MTRTHFTPRSIINLALREALDSIASAQIDPCAGTAVFNIMAINPRPSTASNSR